MLRRVWRPSASARPFGRCDTAAAPGCAGPPWRRVRRAARQASAAPRPSPSGSRRATGPGEAASRGLGPAAGVRIAVRADVLFGQLAGLPGEGVGREGPWPGRPVRGRGGAGGLRQPGAGLGAHRAPVRPDEVVRRAVALRAVTRRRPASTRPAPRRRARRARTTRRSTPSGSYGRPGGQLLPYGGQDAASACRLTRAPRSPPRRPSSHVRVVPARRPPAPAPRRSPPHRRSARPGPSPRPWSVAASRSTPSTKHGGLGDGALGGAQMARRPLGVARVGGLTGLVEARWWRTPAGPWPVRRGP